MLYTRKGDTGTTKLFNTPSGERVPKTAMIFEALGTVDELVAHTGVAKVKCDAASALLGEKTLASILHSTQEVLFVVQAELAGAGMSVSEERLVWIEGVVEEVENTLPPITTFFIAGGSETAAYLDVCRTVSRRMERALLRAVDDGAMISDTTRSFVNRISSLFYALARYENHRQGKNEIPPSYT